jgi:YD repeat-containing protein
MAGVRRLMTALVLSPSCFPPSFHRANSETVSYAYDARERLIRVRRAGTVNDGVPARYTYDKGDNRTNVNVSGTPAPRADQSSKTISVATIDDSAPESSETVTVTPSNRSGGVTPSIPVGVGTSDPQGKSTIHTNPAS